MNRKKNDISKESFVSICSVLKIQDNLYLTLTLMSG